MSSSVVFICSQNTCRSAAAEIVFSYLVKETQLSISVASSGLSAEDGLPASGMVQQAGQLRGYDLSQLRSKAFTWQEFSHFDYFLVVDKFCLEALKRAAPVGQEQKISLLMPYAEFFQEEEILYPNENSIAAFSQLFDYIEDACLGVFHHISNRS